MLVELSAHAGIVVTHDQLQLRVWVVGHSADSGLLRTIVTRLRQKLEDNVNEPLYIFIELEVGYRKGPVDKSNEEKL